MIVAFDDISPPRDVLLPAITRWLALPINGKIAIVPAAADFANIEK